MDKKLITTILFLGGIFILIATIVLGSQRKGSENVGEGEQVRNGGKKSDITYFFREDCPFCNELEKFMEENSVEEYISIQKKDLDVSRTAQLDLTKAARDCGLDLSSVGVPFVLAEGECYMGYPDIVEKLESMLGDMGIVMEPDPSEDSKSEEEETPDEEKVNIIQDTQENTETSNL